MTADVQQADLLDTRVYQTPIPEPEMFAVISFYRGGGWAHNTWVKRGIYSTLKAATERADRLVNTPLNAKVKIYRLS